MKRAAFAAPLAAALAACGGSHPAGPWLTDPGVAGHAFFKLAGTVHDPSAPGSAVTCDQCHPGTSFKQFDCTTSCHAQASIDPIHTTPTAVPGYVYASASCLSCHPDGSGSMPDHSAKLFPIGTGTQHPFQCSQCHTDLVNRSNTATLACFTCHQTVTALPALAAGHAGVKDYPASPIATDCVRCHADGQVTTVASHSQFPIASGSSTHDTACVQCHSAFRADKPWGADFSAYSCVGCHDQTTTDAGHSGLSGYVYASSNCFGCHPTGSAAPANHTPAFFPIGAGTAHASVTCLQCHLDLTKATDPTQFACDTCHAGIAGFSTKHNPVPLGSRTVTILVTRTGQNDPGTAVPLTSPNCLRCHADSQVDRVASHPTGESALGNGNHAGAGCLTCHSTARTDKSYGIDFAATAGCVVCHPNGTGN